MRHRKCKVVIVILEQKSGKEMSKRRHREALPGGEMMSVLGHPIVWFPADLTRQRQ